MDFADGKSTLVQVMAWCRRHRENFPCFTGPKINVLQLFPILNMVIQRSFIGPPIFFTGPPTFSSVKDRGLTSFAESGVVRQQAITWANVDPDLCCRMVPLGHNELTAKPLPDLMITQFNYAHMGHQTLVMYIEPVHVEYRDYRS